MKRKSGRPTKEEYANYLQSKKWKTISEIVKRRSEYKCCQCGSTKDLHVHHKTYEHVFKERLSESMCVCKKCHQKIHDEQRITNARECWIKSLTNKGFSRERAIAMIEADEAKRATMKVEPAVLRSKYVISSENDDAFLNAIDRWLAAYHI